MDARINDTATGDKVLSPNQADIERHLHELFPPAFVHPHPDAWIEIAYGNPATGGRPNEAKHFSAFDLAGASEFAEKKNRAGFNNYVGLALRQGETGPTSKGRASDVHVLTGLYAWADFDGAGDYDRINDTLKDKNLRTSMLVMTGRTPHKRGHPYFKLACGATPAELRSANTALKTLLGTDDVENPSRVMRLAGTISYPPPDKVKRGYVVELVTLHVRKDAPVYTVEQLTGLASKTSSPFGFDFNDTRKPGRNDDELEALLEASRAPNKWHNNIRAAIATMIGRRWPDSAIRFTCKPYCRDGYGDHDLDDLIDRGRAKWNKPDAEATPDLNDEFGQQAKPLGIPLDYYENFGKAVAKKAIIKGVIYNGERSSWIGPPGSGKSALLANIATHAADGPDWRGYRAKERVGVVYFALERGQLAKRRLMAHALQTGKLNLPIAVAGGIINLLNSSCVATIIDTIRTAEAHFGCPVGLIIIDTFNKGIAVGGGDESSAKDQNITAANLQQVQDLQKTC